MEKDPSLDIYFYIIGWICIGVFAVLLALYHVLPAGALPSRPCAIHAITGLYCPGCGGSRAVVCLLHGQLLRSFFYHPFVPYVALFGGWFMLSQTIERLSRGRIAVGLHYRSLYVWITLGVILVNWVIKNAVLLIFGVALLH